MNYEAWAKSHKIHYILGGSRLYGTATEGSDYDFRGVCLMPRAVLLGLQRFEQYEVNSATEDVIIYGVNKFCSLALAANPNILDILFAPTDKWLLRGPECATWANIWKRRHAFLSRRIRKTFSGYAAAQMKSMKKHVEWLADEPQQTNPEDYGCWIETGASGGQRLCWTKDEHKRAYEAAKLDHDNYRAWFANRNPKRLAIEQRVGYDTKAATHLLRLLLKAQEILLAGDYNPVLGHIELAIVREVLAGELAYDTLLTTVSELDENIGVMLTDLPAQPDHATIEGLVEEINWQTVKED